MKVIAIHDTTGAITCYTIDGMFVPLDNENDHHKKIQQWIADGGEVEDRYPDEKRERYSQLNTIFKTKRIGLKRLAVDKPWMDDVGVSEQYENYKDRYQAAKQKAAKDRTDIDKIVIQKFEEMAAKLDPLLTLLDAVKSKIAAEIEAGSDVSAMLDAADAVEMDQITPEAIEAIKQQFGV